MGDSKDIVRVRRLDPCLVSVHRDGDVVVETERIVCATMRGVIRAVEAEVWDWEADGSYPHVTRVSSQKRAAMACFGERYRRCLLLREPRERKADAAG